MFLKESKSTHITAQKNPNKKWDVPILRYSYVTDTETLLHTEDNFITENFTPQFR